MQSIAFENNLSETAFFIKKDDVFLFDGLLQKMKLNFVVMPHCIAHVLFNELGFRDKKIEFNTFFDEKLIVKKKSNYMSMDFPALNLQNQMRI